MTTRTISYIPTEGADINIKILIDNNNISLGSAKALHELYEGECKKIGKTTLGFAPNLTYKFSDGLVFRLFDGTGNESEQNLEFYVAGDEQRKQSVLASIPEKLAQAGIDDPVLLSEIRQALSNRDNKRQENTQMIDQKYGVIMLGKMNGKTVLVAPYTEGRFLEGEMAFSIPKGDPKTEDRKTNANAEFTEETGIDIGLLEKSPNHPARMDSEKKDVFGGAKIIKRIEIAPQTYSANSGRPTELNLDVVLVDNIAGLMPHLKGHNTTFVPARDQATVQSLPTFSELLESLREYGLPQHIQTEKDFDTYVEDKSHIKSLQSGFDAIRSDLEQRGLVGDDEGIKLDNKINPLRYFQERAVVIPIDEFEEKVRSYGEGQSNRKVQAYRNSMLGDGNTQGQLDAILNAIAQVQNVVDGSNLEGGGKNKGD